MSSITGWTTFVVLIFAAAFLAFFLKVRLYARRSDQNRMEVALRQKKAGNWDQWKTRISAERESVQTISIAGSKYKLQANSTRNKSIIEKVRINSALVIAKWEDVANRDVVEVAMFKSDFDNFASS